MNVRNWNGQTAENGDSRTVVVEYDVFNKSGNHMLAKGEADCVGEAKESAEYYATQPGMISPAAVLFIILLIMVILAAVASIATG